MRRTLLLPAALLAGALASTSAPAPAGATEVRLAWCTTETLLGAADPVHAVTDVELSDDGSALFYVREVGDHAEVVRHQVATDQRDVVLERDDIVELADVDADGSHVVLTTSVVGSAGSPNALWVLDVTADELVERTPAGTGAVRVTDGQTISDDGSRLLAGRRGGELEGGVPSLHVIEVADGSSDAIALPADHRYLTDPALSGDGTTVTWTSWEGSLIGLSWAVESLAVLRLDLDDSAPAEVLLDEPPNGIGFNGPTSLHGLSDDGGRLVLSSYAGPTLLLGDGAPNPLPPAAGGDLSGDGSTLLGLWQDLRWFDLDTKSQFATLPVGLRLDVRQARTSSDLSLLAVRSEHLAGDDGVDGVFLVDTTTGRSIEVEATAPVPTPSISADGRTIASSTPQVVAGGDGGTTAEVVVQEGPGTALRSLTSDRRTSDGAAISADGSTVAFRSWADLDGDNSEHVGELFAQDLGTDEVEQLTDTTAGVNEEPSVSVDGQVVAFVATADHTGTNPDLEPHAFVLDRADDQLLDLGAADQVVLSPDARWVAARAGLAIRVHDRSGALGVRPVAEVQGVLQRFSSDGEVLHVEGTGNDDRVVLVHTDDLAVEHVLTLHTVSIHRLDQVALAGDGIHLLVPEGTSVYRLRTDDVAGQRLPEIWADHQLRVADEDGSRWAQLPPGLVLDLWRDGRLEAVTCPAFPDVGFQHPFSEDVEAMAADGVLGGYGNDTFRPSATVTRQAMAAFLYRLAGADDDAPTSAPFDDVSASHPFATEIAWAADEGITTGYPDGTFRPGATVTRQATAAFLHRLTDPSQPAPATAPFSDVGTSHPFATEIAWAADEGITTGYPDGTFRPDATVTRQATAAFLHRTQPLL
jgi:Tol biopolymer transport system component